MAANAAASSKSSDREDLERTVDLLQFQVNLLGHVLYRLAEDLDIDFDQLLVDAEREMARPDLRLVEG